MARNFSLFNIYYGNECSAFKGLQKSTNLNAKETVFAGNNFIFKRDNVKSIAR